MANFSLEHHSRPGISNNRIQEECKLYVKYLPQELTEDDICKIFSNFGKITGVCTFKNVDWAYISFFTRQDAENAIKELHDKAPLNLDISFAKGNNTKNSYHQDENHSNSKRTDQSPVQSMFHKRTTDTPVSHTMRNSGIGNNIDDTTRQNTKLHHHPDFWSRGVLNNVGNQRYLDLGPNYPMYNIPNPQPQVEEQIARIVQKRSTEPHEKIRDQARCKMGPCQYCADMTSTMCGRCCMFYCSTKCQMTDWFSHKNECQPIPALIKPWESSAPSFQSNGEEQVSGSKFPNKLISHNSDVAFQNPVKKFVDPPMNNTTNNEDKNEFDKDVFRDENGQKHCQSYDGRKSPRRDQRNHEKRRFNHVQPRNEGDLNREQFQFDKERNSDRRWKNSDKKIREKPNRGTRSNQDNQEDDFLSKTQFERVKIIVVENDTYWIQKVEDQDAVKNFEKLLMNSAQKGRVVDPMLNHVYGIEYEGLWYRVRITSLDPIRGRFVDFGYHDLIENNECHLIHDVRELPKFARKIRLSHDSAEKYKNLKPNDILSVQMVFCNSDHIEVEVRENDHQALRNNFQSNNSNEKLNPDPKDIKPNSYNHDNMRKYYEPDRNQTQKYPIVNSTSMNDDKECQEGAEGVKKPLGSKFSEEALEVEQHLTFAKDFISKSRFTKIEIVVIEKDEYWIHKVKSKEGIARMMCDLQDAAGMVQSVIPEIGNMYAVLYEGIWHRAIVKSLNPLTVHYVDFGNDEIIKSPDFRPIPNFTNIPRFAKKIRIASYSNHESNNIVLGSILYVKMVSVDQKNIITVEIQGHDEKSNQRTPGDFRENSSTTIELPSVLDSLSLGVSGIIEVHSVISLNNYNITLTPQHRIPELERIWVDLNNHCSKLEVPKDYKPYLDELVCGKTESGNWVRGHITNLSCTNPVQIAHLDEVKEISVSKVLPYPKEFLNICAFGLSCRVVDSELQMNVGETWSFKVTGPHEIKIDYYDDSLTAVVRCPRRN